MYYTTTQSPYGQIDVIYDEDHVYFLEFSVKSEPIWLRLSSQLSILAKEKAIEWSQIAKLTPKALIGTDFQKEVWQALMAIPHGQTRSYQDIATSIGRSKAVRAVGQAIGRNPIAILIPCHRVVTSDHRLGGYHWGVALKTKLLEAENIYLGS